LFKKSQIKPKESSQVNENIIENKASIGKNEEKDIFKMEESNNAINSNISLPKSSCFFRNLTISELDVENYIDPRLRETRLYL
jgi:hypothetical protein